MQDIVSIVREHEIAIHLGHNRKQVKKARHFLRFELRSVMHYLFCMPMTREELEALLEIFTPAMMRYVEPFHELLHWHKEFDKWIMDTNRYDYECYDDLLYKLDARLWITRFQERSMFPRLPWREIVDMVDGASNFRYALYHEDWRGDGALRAVVGDTSF